MRSNAAGVGFYNSEPRRGFGRGIPKTYQPSQRNPAPQPSRKGDLFIEAGRLAVEYLVSRRLLSSDVLSGKYQNGNLRNSSGESHDRDSIRRSSVDPDLAMSRNYPRERRRLGLSRTCSSDLSRDNEREGSVTEEAVPSMGMEVDNDKFQKETIKDIHTSVQDSRPSEPAAKDDRQSTLQNEVGNGDLESKVSSLIQNEDDKEVMIPDAVNSVFEESKNGGTDNHDKEKDTIMDDLDVQQCEEKTSASHLMDSNLKVDPLLISRENIGSETGNDSADSKKTDTMNGSEVISGSNCLVNTVSDHSFKEAGIMSPAYPVDQQKSSETLSFIEKSFSYEQKSSGLPDLGIFSSIAKDRGEKRPFEEENMMEGAKKAKQQWLSVARSDEYSRLSDFSDEHSVSPPKRSISMFNVSASQENFTDASLPLKGGVDSNINQEEKQLLSESFKICDLNLMEASDMHENHDVPALLYPTISGSNQNLQVDIDLSMRNYNDSGSVRKNIEIIDLESESLEGCKSSNTPMKNTDAGITSMESFANPQNSTDNADGQDGYGFMISELLGNDVPNCSSVQPDMNPLHNDMGLNHGEGMFSEDDPIYMSLGEIPLSLLRAWEQPTQERNPFEL